MTNKDLIVSGKTALGIELGSTRVKAILIGEDHETLATGSYEWENKYENHIWTYDLDEVWCALRGCYADLVKDVMHKYGIELEEIGYIGFSGMMHGYMAFDGEDQLLVPFRTWRNTITERACKLLTDVFQYNIPQRWSIAHLYESILKDEPHVKDIRFLTTLSGYIHWQLTGEKVLGIGDVSGMFPIDSTTKDYDRDKVNKFNELIKPYAYSWKLEDILPRVGLAGEKAGTLTREGAKLLDPTGKLKGGIPVCPPEGDAGTGMVATNSIAVKTGNVSAGTSIFAMLVLEKPLNKMYPEIDLVTTPCGDLVAMVHCNNCTSDLDAWVSLFKEFTQCLGVDVDKTRLFSLLYNKALEGDPECDGLLAYNYFAGEHITGFEEGRPLFVRSANAKFNLANFMRTQLSTTLGALKIGLDILLKEEGVHVENIMGHGGLFKTKEVGQKIMAAAMNAPVSVMETAAEGGAWGIAILAMYAKNRQEDEDLTTYLKNKVFNQQKSTTIHPDLDDVKGFEVFMERYRKGLPIERAAVEALR